MPALYLATPISQTQFATGPLPNPPKSQYPSHLRNRRIPLAKLIP